MLEADPDSLVLLAVVFLAVAALRIWLVHVWLTGPAHPAIDSP